MLTTKNPKSTSTKAAAPSSSSADPNSKKMPLTTKIPKSTSTKAAASSSSSADPNSKKRPLTTKNPKPTSTKAAASSSSSVDPNSKKMPLTTKNPKPTSTKAAASSSTKAPLIIDESSDLDESSADPNPKMARSDRLNNKSTSKKANGFCSPYEDEFDGLGVTQNAATVDPADLDFGFGDASASYWDSSGTAGTNFYEAEKDNGTGGSAKGMGDDMISDDEQMGLVGDEEDDLLADDVPRSANSKSKAGKSTGVAGSKKGVAGGKAKAGPKKNAGKKPKRKGPGRKKPKKKKGSYFGKFFLKDLTTAQRRRVVFAGKKRVGKEIKTVGGLGREKLMKNIRLANLAKSTQVSFSYGAGCFIFFVRDPSWCF